MTQLDLDFVERTVCELGRDAEAVVPILQAIQNHYRYLPAEALQRVCQLTDITPAAITGVSTFYRRFRHRPVGRHMIHICHGTACHVKGSGLIQDAVAHHLRLARARTRTARAALPWKGSLVWAAARWRPSFRLTRRRTAI